MAVSSLQCHGHLGYVSCHGDTGQREASSTACRGMFSDPDNSICKTAGDQFALFEAVVALAMLMRRYEFTIDPAAPEVHHPLNRYCLNPRAPVCIADNNRAPHRSKTTEKGCSAFPALHTRAPATLGHHPTAAVRCTGVMNAVQLWAGYGP